MILNVYNPGARVDKPTGLKWFATLIIHCKFLPLVFSIFIETDFSIFPHTHAQERKFDHAVKGQMST